MLIYRIFTRTYVNQNQLDQAIEFYEELTSEKCGLRVENAPAGLLAGVVGGVHVIAGAEAGLYKFKAATATYLVDHVEEFVDRLLTLGAEILEETQTLPQGHSLHVRHPDGTIVEYVDGETS